MDILKLPGQLLALCGVWRPSNFTTKSQKLMWIIYSSVCSAFTFTGFMGMFIHFLGARNFDQFFERMFLLPTVGITVTKSIFLMKSRSRIRNIENMFLQSLCLPRNTEEVFIKKTYENNLRKMLMICVLMALTTMTAIALIPVLSEHNYRNFRLPLIVWLPITIESYSTYAAAFVWEAIAGFLIAVIATVSSWVPAALFQSVCTQYDILIIRWNKLPSDIKKFRQLGKSDEYIDAYEKKVLKENVGHHLYIFRLAETINKVMIPLFLQAFFSCAIIILTSIYQLGTSKIDIYTIINILVISCVVTESGVYFWFSNEVYLKSTDFQNEIYSINWQDLNLSMRKSILLVMIRSSRPIIIRCGPLITLVLGTYISILKTSYSVYNLLRKATE